MRRTYLQIMSQTLCDLAEAKASMKERIFREWEESKKLPWKKKKRKRRELRLDWCLLQYNPFEQ